MRFVVIGLTITSSWGNGHATTYRALVRELERRGHRVTFLEHDKPYYAAHRDMPRPPWGETRLYASVEELTTAHAKEVRDADVVVVGSYVPEGARVAEWALATAGGSVMFYDIDTPVTFAKLQRGDHEYLRPDLVPRFDAYLSFTGGPMLQRIEREWGARRALPLYCSVDPELYFPEEGVERDLHLGYLGTYSADRQPPLERLLLEPARRWPEGRFLVAGPMYPPDVAWPANVARVDHLPPAEHRRFYNRQRLTLNVTRADMVAAGWSPSVRLFEAAACGTPVLSDPWEGLDHFFRPGQEILVARTSGEALAAARDAPEDGLQRIGRAARERVLAAHTAAHRARELEAYAREAVKGVASHA